MTRFPLHSAETAPEAAEAHRLIAANEVEGNLALLPWAA